MNWAMQELSEYRGQPMDEWLSELDAWERMVTRRFLCPECGRRLVVPPPRRSEETPICCQWEMAEIPPAGLVSPSDADFLAGQ